MEKFLMIFCFGVALFFCCIFIYCFISSFFIFYKAIDEKYEKKKGMMEKPKLYINGQLVDQDKQSDLIIEFDEEPKWQEGAIPMEDNIITRTGLFNIQVCSKLSEEKALEWVREAHPAGTTGNWQKPIEKKLGPVQCKEYPDRKHYVFAC